MLAPRLDAGARVQQAQVVALADHEVMAEAENAGEGDIEERDNADLRRLDDVLAEAGDVAGSRRAGIDHRGDAALLRVGIRIDAKRRAAPVDMRMQIDQARHDEQAGHVALRLGSTEPLPDRRDLAVGERHVGLRLEALGRVEHDPVAQDQIEHATPPQIRHETKRHRTRADR
jgi:hypothetical protein